MRGKSKNSYIIIAIILLMLVCCTSCGGKDTEPLSDKLWTEMQASWLDEYKVKIPWDGETGYYGTYQEDVVVYIDVGPLAMITEITVAGVKFSWPSSFVIRVYSEGEFSNLETAYEKGLVTQEDVSSIADKHEDYLYACTNWERTE